MGSLHEAHAGDGESPDEGTMAIYTSAGGLSLLPGAEARAAADACRRLGGDAFVLESADHATIAVLDGYDGSCAVAVCDPGASLSAIIRGLRARLYVRDVSEGPGRVLPAAAVRPALRRWERQIAVVFGRNYAARLVSRIAGDKDQGTMTIDDLEGVCRQLSVAIAGCIELKTEKQRGPGAAKGDDTCLADAGARR